jgi:hypothetical protein
LERFFGANIRLAHKFREDDLTMTRRKRIDEMIQVMKHDLMRMLTEDEAMKSRRQTRLQEVLETELGHARRAGKNERTSGRLR